jgi:RNA polymerase sigma factor (sigma-70 family)
MAKQVFARARPKRLNASMNPAPVPAATPEFPVTRWSVLRRLDASKTQVASEALETLCRAYRFPIYAFLRRSGHSPEDAEDWTQSFFAYLIERRLAERAEPERGHFRSFLLGSLKNFVSTEQRKLAAQKRGGGRALLSLDGFTEEERYAREPVEHHTPETLFELSWSRAVIARSLLALERQYLRRGDTATFALLKPCLAHEPEAQSYAAIASATGKSEDAVKSAMLRLRQQFQQCLRLQLLEIVDAPSDVDHELLHLRQTLGR